MNPGFESLSILECYNERTPECVMNPTAALFTCDDSNGDDY